MDSANLRAVRTQADALCHSGPCPVPGGLSALPGAPPSKRLLWGPTCYQRTLAAAQRSAAKVPWGLAGCAPVAALEGVMASPDARHGAAGPLATDAAGPTAPAPSMCPAVHDGCNMITASAQLGLTTHMQDWSCAASAHQQVSCLVQGFICELRDSALDTRSDA